MMPRTERRLFGLAVLAAGLVCIVFYTAMVAELLRGAL